MSLDFRSEIWAGDVNLVVSGTWVILNALALVGITLVPDSLYVLDLHEDLACKSSDGLRQTCGDPSTLGDEYGPQEVPRGVGSLWYQRTKLNE